MGNSQISELLESISQDPEDSHLSTSHCLAAGIVLQDCANGKFFQDCAPEVLLAADILTSRASQSSFKAVPTTTKSGSQDRNPFLSREGNVPKVSKPKEAWRTKIEKT
ncbi:hypothetical protein ACRRTK_005344 [Alexandromys fortis]